MLGVRVVEVRADYPTADMAGRILYAADTDLRDEALVVVAGEIGQPDWPPEWPSRSAPAGDERRLAEIVDELDLDRRGWDALCAEAEEPCSQSGDRPARVDDRAVLGEGPGA